MKKLLCIILFLSSVSVIKAQEIADNIIGTYSAPENKAMIEISKRDDKYYGKFLWTKTEGHLDLNNPVESERTKPLKGLEFLKNFVFDGKKTWKNGTIYDPENGKTYKCKIKRTPSGNLDIKGFVGFALLGRSVLFTKVAQ